MVGEGVAEDGVQGIDRELGAVARQGGGRAA